MLGIFDFSNVGIGWLIVVVIILAIWLFKEGGDGTRMGCAVIFIIFSVFFIKTCREIDEEEALEEKRSEEAWKKIQEEKEELERRKRERLKEISLEEYIKELDTKK